MLYNIELLSMPPNDDIIDALTDLQHDLGKYIHMPLSYLPEEAPADEVLAALRRGLLETRTAPSGLVSARALWDAFVAEAGSTVSEYDAYRALSQTVQRALAWVDRMDLPIDRQRAQTDLAAVAPATRALREAIEDG